MIRVYHYNILLSILYFSPIRLYLFILLSLSWHLITPFESPEATLLRGGDNMLTDLFTYFKCENI